jgi:dihydroneopterin aldolase
MEVDTSAAERSDQLKDTVNYQSVFQLVKKEMETPSKLLEHVGRRILDRVKQEFSEVVHARIKIRKLNPPLGGKMDFVSLELSF